MNCPNCMAAVDQGAKFCRQCGSRIGVECPACGAFNPSGSKYCGDCGSRMTAMKRDSAGPSEPVTDVPVPSVGRHGERRHVTILFTDLTGYTALSEKHDPEDVQAMMAAVQSRVVAIILKYHGHVERVIGDGILAVFGLPASHEDDPVRAIKAAREIHQTIGALQPFQSMGESEPISMHTGINTGLVVTANPHPMDGAYALSGDAVNLASRLSDMAEPNTILVGPETYRQASGIFDFAVRPPEAVKGKTDEIQAFAVLRVKDRPVTVRRKTGLQARLVGRRLELSQLRETMTRLKQGCGSICAIIGEAGTGKSRLLYEFETEFAADEQDWITGFAYAHTQPIPYYPLLDLVRRWLNPEEIFTSEDLKALIINRVGAKLGPDAEEIPIIQGLLGLDVPETEGMSPEIWQKRLTAAVTRLMSAIAAEKPTVFCLEDLHWADTASLDLLRAMLAEFGSPSILLCTYRPQFSLFTSGQSEALGTIYREIRLSELSPSEAKDMMESLLSGGVLPLDLVRLIRDRAEGNPFYLEEMVNALIDAGALIYHQDQWQLKRAFLETDVPSTIHGVIASRLDQLSLKARRVLQEASVAGRAFLYDILKRISVYSEGIEEGLYELERSGLVHTRAMHPEMEFMFKHALIQEVGYSSLLRKERQQVHERIALVMEQIFSDRLYEFYETLALHFKQGLSTAKAVKYLIRSGTKALRRCALEESDQYFREARAILEDWHSESEEENALMLDVINEWAFVFYFRGRNRELLALFQKYQPLLDNLGDPSREGMYWAWHGCALWHRHRFMEAYECLSRAIALGKQADDDRLLAYANTWMSFPCIELGKIDEAIACSQAAQRLYEEGRVKDPYVFFHALAGSGYAFWHRGDRQATYDIGTRLLEFGRHQTNIRSLVMGHCCHGWSYLISGDMARAAVDFEEAVRISADPWYAQFPILALCYGRISSGQSGSALNLLNQLMAFSDAHGAEFVGEPARFFHRMISVQEGDVEEGIARMEQLLEKWRGQGCRLRYLTCGFVMACVYRQLHHLTEPSSGAEGTDRSNPFLQKALDWYRSCTDTAKELGAGAMHGRTLLELGSLYQTMGSHDEASDAYRKSAALFEQSDAGIYLQQAREKMDKLKKSGLGQPFKPAD
ncbi:MAG: AAA family ATPase [Deltaproteobacteria bacterium]|nr:AAA family ATPase [Deltaproteobacteria bacterium]